MLRGCEHLRRGPFFDDSPSLHDIDPVGDGSHHIEIMRYE
jgi:hypothetical protein